MNETGQERAVNSFFAAENEIKESFGKKFGRVCAKLLLLILETVLLAAIVLYAGMYILAKGPSPAIRKIFVTSVRETSAVGFLAELYLSDEEMRRHHRRARQRHGLCRVYDGRARSLAGDRRQRAELL